MAIEYDISNLRISENPSGKKLYSLSQGFKHKGCQILETKFRLASEITKNNPLKGTLSRHDSVKIIETNSKKSNWFQWSRKKNEKFDFIIVPAQATGCVALYHFALWHPKITVPRLNEVDLAISDDNLSSLPRLTKDFSAMASGNKHGIILHNYIPGNATLLDAEHWYVTAKKMKDAVNANNYFLIVRDPIEMLEHLLIKQIIIKEIFPLQSLVREDNPFVYNNFEQIDLSTLPNKHINTVQTLKASGEKKKFALGKLKDFAKSWECPYLKIEDVFRNYFDKTILIDNSDLFPDKIKSTLRLIYGEIGVNNSFIHPLAFFPMNTWINRFLNTIHLDFIFKKYPIPLGINLADSAGYSAWKENIELAWTDPCDTWLQLGFPDRKLCLSTPYKFWDSIPFATRKELLKTDLLEKALHSTVYPTIFNLWKSWWGVISPAIEEMRNNKVLFHPGDFIEDNKEDITSFIDRHPELSKKWKNFDKYNR